MKINVLLAIVGVGFSYSLIIFRSSLDATPESEFSEDYVVIQVDSQRTNTDSAIRIDLRHVNTNSAIQIVSPRVNGALIMQELKSCISVLKKMDKIILREFYKYSEIYLEVHNFSKNQVENHFEVHIFSKDQVATDHNLFIDLLPQETINRLQETVKQMVAAGFEKECCHVYSSCRRKFLQKCLMILQLSEFNSKEFQGSSIEKWMKASGIVLRILFPCERKLCDRVFFGFSSVADVAFMEVCRELTVGLVDFPINSISPITWQLIGSCSLNNLDSSLIS
ncbi:hypothetical protein RIF29_17200 [Crotalaria pallida]|uniref:Exocyst subunit Exo70 family protein n=1 Tax=Crotalaria pallida TaxID=3830 RepID=A0AAN9ICR2_CROPI